MARSTFPTITPALSIAYARSRAVRTAAEVEPHAISPLIDPIAEGGAERFASVCSSADLTLHQLYDGIAIDTDIRHPNTAIARCVENQ
jgi:hypothetical protein